MKKGDKKLITQGLDIGLTCSILEIKQGGSILVRIDGTERETHLADFELKDIGIISALETLKLMRKFDEDKSQRIEKLEEENNKLNNRILKLLDAKF